VDISNNKDAVMRPESINLVQETWQQVAPIADKAAGLFYDRLFTIDPTIRSLFRSTDMQEQRRKLLQVLGVAVHSLSRLEALIPTVEELGRRHAGYGVTDSHYGSVGAALLWTLERGLGPAWTAETAAAWREAYGLLAGVMRRAASEAATTAPGIVPAAEGAGA